MQIARVRNVVDVLIANNLSEMLDLHAMYLDDELTDSEYLTQLKKLKAVRNLCFELQEELED